MVPRLDRLGPAAVAVVAVALCACTVAVTVTGSSSDYAWVEAVARALMVATPLAVGAYALHRPPFERFGKLLIAAGLAWFLTTLAGSDDAVLYSIGRIAGWLAEPLLIYLILVFPSGRLENRLDRRLVWAAVLLVALLYVPTALVVDGYPMPAPWTTCGDACPGNAFMVTGSEPAVVEDLVRPLRELIAIALFAAVAVRLAYRIRGATPLTRRTLAPVLVVAIFRFGAFSLTLLGRQIAPDSGLVEVATWLLAAAVPLLAVAFLVGLARWWVFIAVSTQRLAARLHGHPRPGDLRAALADAFDDPGLEIVYRIQAGWADADGRVLERPPPPSNRWLTEVRDDDRLVAAIVHDPALKHDRAFIDAATSYALMALDNQRLSAQTSSLLREVRRSRARIQAAADDERRRIERDLHDGAQQRLVALRIKLELAAEGSNGDGTHAAMLRRLGGEVEQALEEVRDLARGIYPAPLADRGLVEGLRAAALRSPLPTTVLAAGVHRYSREIESAAYFCCLEAMQNAAKHASDATAAVIELSDNGALRVEVRDDGGGFDAGRVPVGVGLGSMRDRVAAVGGEVAIESSPGRGTRVTVSIPLGGDEL